jgi:hypothetical protein
MDTTIVAALIGAGATVVSALLGGWFLVRSNQPKNNSVRV